MSRCLIFETGMTSVLEGNLFPSLRGVELLERVITTDDSYILPTKKNSLVVSYNNKEK